jgi:flavin-dependent dehydrogenase
MTRPVVIGGGPAGCAAALLLARAGRRPILLERSITDGNRLCGGFLSWDTLRHLSRLGIDTDTLGAAPIGRVRLVADGRVVEGALPHAAAGLSRQRLDAALIAAAGAAGADVRRGARVRRIESSGAGHVVCVGADRLPTSRLFLATGKHDLAGQARDQRGTHHSNVAFRQTLTPLATNPVAGVVELHLFDHGYAGLAPVEGGRVNLCLVVARSFFNRTGGSWVQLLAALRTVSPAFATRLDQMRSAEQAPEAIANVPYGMVRQNAAAGFFRLGDQAAVIPSLVGDGIGMALASAFAATGGDDAPVFQPAFAHQVAPAMRAAGLLRTLSENRIARGAALRLLGVAPGLLPLAARVTRAGATTAA